MAVSAFLSVLRSSDRGTKREGGGGGEREHPETKAVTA